MSFYVSSWNTGVLVGSAHTQTSTSMQHLMMDFNFTAAAEKSSTMFRTIYPKGYLKFIFEDIQHIVQQSPRLESILAFSSHKSLYQQRVHLSPLNQNSSGILFCPQFSRGSLSNSHLCPENTFQILFLLCYIISVTPSSPFTQPSYYLSSFYLIFYIRSFHRKFTSNIFVSFYPLHKVMSLQ